MRIHRVIIGLVALVIAVAMTLVVGTGAEAADKPKHEVIAKGIEPTPNKFLIKGQVKPTYANAPLVMEKKDCGSCDWHAWKKFSTHDDSHYKLRVYGPGKGSQKTCYRVKVPPTQKFALSRSQVLCIVKL
ncbi:hypothetical protein FB382_003409 [Nocardioides ginsengisegetis]|uniref:Uncharacterized protein n=1 Tax=Nocardioides ginsengisegetis TaxID=661491 RepID=A0A7W3J2K0_9ACTN|nr:hypothetical protein [Nocardioides ginsengisegetis]MBA8805118.1 hypothetical protein [Nocardioides ginsengisegetis]